MRTRRPSLGLRDERHILMIPVRMFAISLRGSLRPSRLESGAAERHTPPMRFRTISLLMAALSVLIGNAVEIRFHCLIDRSERSSCCCTGSTTQACGGSGCSKVPARAKACCASRPVTGATRILASGTCCLTSLAPQEPREIASGDDFSPTPQAHWLARSFVLVQVSNPPASAGVVGAGPPPLLTSGTLRC